MTKQIRKSVFETNSSSSHSLTMAPEDLVAQPFSDEVLRSGKLPIVVGDYGWEWYRYYSPEGKIAYLVTQITNGDTLLGPGITEELREEYDAFDMLFRVVKQHTGVEIEVLPSTPSIDHQSVGEGMALFVDEEKLRNFLFSPNSYVQTGNDNDCAPALMNTDRGTEPTYVAWFATPAPDSVATKFQMSRWPDTLTALNGDVIERDSPVMEQLQKHGVVVSVRWEVSKRYSPFEYSDSTDVTQGELARREFRFVNTLPVEVVNLGAPKDPRDEGVIATLTVMLPQELAARFSEAH